MSDHDAKLALAAAKKAFAEQCCLNIRYMVDNKRLYSMQIP